MGYSFCGASHTPLFTDMTLGRSNVNHYAYSMPDTMLGAFCKLPKLCNSPGREVNICSLILQMRKLPKVTQLLKGGCEPTCT